MTMTILAEQIDMLEHTAPMALWGTVVQVRGLALHVSDLPVPVGATVHIMPQARLARPSDWCGDAPIGSKQSTVIEGEVIGFDHDQTIVMPLASVVGVGRGDLVMADQFQQQVRVGRALLGRVLDARGRPIDGRGPLQDTSLRCIWPEPIDPMARPQINAPLATGIRAIDALHSVGRGQRLGIFAAPGIGKSVLLGQMARCTAADVSVIALVGERGREVVDFLENQLGTEGLARSVVVCATSDEPALLRLRAALVATTIAEFFRDQGQDVLMIMDSLSRFCHAQRQVGLSCGEPPMTKGYPPSVFAAIPKLLERTGRTSAGSITGFYAVLVEGDDLDDPVADSVRSVLDGHIMLSRKLANRGHWPAIDLLESVSRVSDDVISAEHRVARRDVLGLVGAYQEIEDLLNVGAYAAGSNSECDLAIACKPVIDQLVCQGRSEVANADFERTSKQLVALSLQIAQAKKNMQRSAGPVPVGPRPQMVVTPS